VRRVRHVPLGHLIAAVLTVGILTDVAACADDDGEAAMAPDEDAAGSGRPTSGGELIGPADEGIDGVVAYRVDSNAHTEDEFGYQLVPPVGGEHFPVPATCGFYDGDPPPDELIVHDLEHGAIWIAYALDLDAEQLRTISELVAQQAKVIATPVEGLGTPVVVSAWGRQLPLDSADDPRLVQFVEAYRNSANAPEPGAACQGAGEPAVASPTA
jgi:Protein of unknown function (DUF3105)